MTFLISVSALTMGVSAKQVAPGDPIADLNGDGNVTLHEVVTFNRDQRNKR
ncbi:MAG: hypothetical protein AAF703_07430 [Cyanobacteria bacterium P01_D01_bin.105]